MDEISDYQENKHSLDSMRERRAMIEYELTCTKSPRTDSEPVKGGGSKQEDRMCALITEKMIIDESTEITRKRVELVESGLQCLDEAERDILLRMCVMDRRQLKGIADDLAYEYNTSVAGIYRIRNDAIRKYKRRQFGA